LRGDLRSVYEAQALAPADALANELRIGLLGLRADGVAGARRFSDGAGRHGA